MQPFAKRYGTAQAAVARAGAARVKGLMGNVSWPVPACFVGSTARHEIEPRRLPVIPI